MDINRMMNKIPEKADIKNLDDEILKKINIKKLKKKLPKMLMNNNMSGRRIKQMRRAGIAVAIISGTAGVLSYCSTRRLVNIALDREPPVDVRKAGRRRTKLRGVEEESDFLQTIQIAGEKLKNTKSVLVEITSYDGEKMVAHWLPASEPERIIIAMHGWRSTWAKDFGLIADYWHDSGCSVLYVEQRGQNLSGGQYMGFGLAERYDCIEWIRYINRKHGTDVPVYLAGISMGATAVLMAAGMRLPYNVRGIIADSAYTSPHEQWKHVVKKNLHMRYGLRGSTARRLCRKKILMNSDEYSTLDAMQSNRVPVLFIHGTDDKFVPLQMTFENYKACDAPKKLFIVPGAGHGMGYYIDPVGYQKMLAEFWEEFD